MDVAKRYQDELPKIKENIKNSYISFKPNYDRFNEFRRFIFDTSISSEDSAVLSAQGKPNIEFNVSEAYISRLMGEFSKQEPSIAVGSEDEDQADPKTIHIVEAHIRHILRDNKNYHTRWELMKDIYSGGFSVAKLWTDYAHKMSMDQVLIFDKTFDPCMTGFDQMARRSHKGDGAFCFELFPRSLEMFKAENPGVKTDKFTFNRQFSGFNWSYVSGNEKIIMVADYYKKKEKHTKIVRLMNNQVVTMSEYEKMLEMWEQSNPLVPPPAMKGKSRTTTIETISRFRCVESEVIEHVDTDFTFFPLVFFDGNSILLRNTKTAGAAEQMTRPYVYHAKGAQKLKNFAGITLANEMENIVQSKFLVAKEALPKEQDWLFAYKDIQKPNNMIFNAFFEQNPDQPIPNPIREIQRVPIPPEVAATFASTDSLIQNVLGSYDAALGINDNQLSGVALVEAATQSNAAAMPYIVGFLQGLQRVAEIIVDLIPKYYTTPRTIPVMGIDGTRDYVKINQDENNPDMNYDTNVLNVSVEAGVSFQIQKSRALQQLIALQQSSPLFAQFMNEKGLPVLLDNIEIRGIDQLKLEVEDWLVELQKQKQMAQQQAQNNPQVIRNQIEMQKVQQNGQKMIIEKEESDQQHMIDVERLKQDQMKILTDAAIAKDQSLTQRVKAETERFSKQVDLAMKKKDMHHRHFKEAIELQHGIKMDKQQASMGAMQ